MSGPRWLRVAADAVPAGNAWLADGERARLASLRVPPRREDFRLGRFTAKCALALDAGLALSSANLRRFEIAAAADGAPEARKDGAAADRVVSLSHRDGVAVCAVADAGAALGCDLEVVEPRSRAFLRDYFGDGERRRIEAAGDGGRDAALALSWSAKESALKLVREGLRRDTRDAEVEDCALREGAWSPLSVCLRPEGRRLAGWARRDDDRVLTLLCDPPGPAPRELAGLPTPGLAA